MEKVKAKKRWYQLAPSEVLGAFSVEAEKGLSKTEVTHRLQQYGRNELHGTKPINPLALFLSQFKDVLIIVLLLAAAVSFGLAFVEENGSIRESLLIFAIALLLWLPGSALVKISKH